MHPIKITTPQATTLSQMLFGLIFKKPTDTLFLRTSLGIHTLGMRFPIDVVVLDSSYKVQLLKEGLLPNRVFFWNPKYDRILELPAGTIKARKIKKGSYIKVVLI